MSPVPEPLQGGRSNPRDGDEDGVSPPSGLILGHPISSSDEEADQVDHDDPNLSGYQPLPQDFDDENEDTEIDYNSLSGLMSALSTHGPTVVTDNVEERTDENNLSASVDAVEQDVRVSSQTEELVDQSARQRQDEELEERASIWSSPASDRLNLDGSKVEEIKSVMAAFILPQSAIPPWAQNISDEDLTSQIAGLISKQKDQ